VFSFSLSSSSGRVSQGESDRPVGKGARPAFSAPSEDIFLAFIDLSSFSRTPVPTFKAFCPRVEWGVGPTERVPPAFRSFFASELMQRPSTGPLGVV